MVKKGGFYMSKQRKLKKGLLLVVFVGCIFSLTACDYTYYLYHNTDGNETFLNKDVTTIELIEYKNPKVYNDPLRKHELDLNKLEVIETLNTDDFKSFTNELIKIGGLSGKFKQELNSPCGMGFRIIYDDGSFTLVTVSLINGKDCIFLGEYGADEKIGITFGIAWQDMINEFKALINKHFTTQI